MSTEKIVAANTRILRANLRLSQAQVAEKAGISTAYVAKIESGNGNMTLEVLGQLARALDVTPGQLVTKIVLHDQAAYARLHR
jgi:transcriptional regulator with XRE-family HTH domain